jgi:hypothetical protein
LYSDLDSDNNLFGADKKKRLCIEETITYGKNYNNENTSVRVMLTRE